jgi:hypothetical protein
MATFGGFESCPFHYRQCPEEANMAAKDKPKIEKTVKHLAWLAAEEARVAASEALKAAEPAADLAAAEFAAELKASGKTGAYGPGDVVYIVQTNRKPKCSTTDASISTDAPIAPDTFTLRRAPTVKM